MAVPRHYMPSLNLHAVVDVLNPQKFSVHFMQHCTRQLSAANKWTGPGREGARHKQDRGLRMFCCLYAYQVFQACTFHLLSRRESAKRYQIGEWGFAIVQEGQHCTRERGGPYQSASMHKHLPPAITTTFECLI